MAFLKLIDWFVPKHIYSEESETIRRPRTVSGLILVLIAFIPFFLVVYFLFGHTTNVFIQIAAFVIGLLFLLYMKRFGISAVYVHSGIFGLLAIYIATSITTGGNGAPGLLWISIVPVIAIHGSNRNGAFFWTVASILALAGLFLAEIKGLPIRQELSKSQIEILWLLVVIGLLIINLTFALLFDYNENRSKRIIEQKNAESRFIKSAIEESGDAILVYNTKNEQIFANRQFAKILGFETAEELYQKGFKKAPNEKRKLINIYKETLQGKSWNGELDITNKEGNTIPIHARTDAVRNDSGEVIAAIAIFRDISEQKRVEQSLRESQKMYQLVTENATDAIWIRDLDLKVSYISPSIERMRGFTPEEIKDLPLEKNLTPKSLEKVNQILASELALALKDPEREIILETENYCKDGSTIWVEDSIKFLLDDENKPLQIIGITRDITERKKAEEQLKEARAELVENAHRAGMADIAAGTLHNIGNLLNSVKTSTEGATKTLENSSVDELKKANSFFIEHFENHEAFNEEESDGKKLLQYYLFLEKALLKENQSIAGEINRLKAKIDAITDVIASQQRFAGFSPLTESYSLETLVNDVLEIESSSLSSLGINIRKEFDSVPKVGIQKTKLLHILVNLIKNAEEALTEKPRDNRKILISLDQQDGNIFLRIIDNGIGISKEDQQKIFTHGFTTKEDGYGFGLHSCAIYMDDMGGKIWFESEGLNKGTTFVLKFPVAE